MCINIHLKKIKSSYKYHVSNFKNSKFFMGKHLQQQNRQLLIKVNQIITNQQHTTRYQRWLIVFILVLSFSLSFKKQSFQYFFINPFFTCNYTDKLVRQNQACKHLDMCTIKNGDTLTAKLHLYCGSKKAQRNLIQSLKGIGGWVGTLSVGIIADVYGRKVCMLISLICLNLSLVLLVAGALTYQIIFFVISQLLQGIGNKFIFSIALIFMTRFLRKETYETATNAWYIVGGGVSHILLAGANHLIHDWFYITLISAVPLFILLLLTPSFIKEDPILLFQKGRQEQFKTVVRQISQFNGKNQEQIVQSLRKVSQLELMRVQLEKKTKKAKTMAQLCRIIGLNKYLLFHTIILGIVHLVCDLTTTGIKFSLQEVGFGYNVNIVVLGVSQVLGSFTMIYILKMEARRKRGFMISTVSSLIISLLLLFPFIHSSKIVQQLIIFILKYFLAFIFAFLIRLQVDSLPESYQVSLFSIIEIFSITHSVVGPYIIQFGVDHKFDNIVFTHILRFAFGTLLMIFISQERIEIHREHQDDIEIQPIPKAELEVSQIVKVKNH